MVCVGVQASVYSPLIKHVWSGSVLFTSIFLHPVIQTCPDCGSLLRTRISIQLSVQDMFGFWFRVGVQASVWSPLISIIGFWCLVVSSIVQTRVDCGSLFAYTHRLFSCVSHVGLWFRASAQASVFGHTLDQTRLDYGSVSVYKHLSPPTFDQTRLDWGSLLCTSISLHPCFKHILLFLVRVHHQSTALCLKHV